MAAASPRRGRKRALQGQESRRAWERRVHRFRAGDLERQPGPGGNLQRGDSNQVLLTAVVGGGPSEKGQKAAHEASWGFLAAGVFLARATEAWIMVDHAQFGLVKQKHRPEGGSVARCRKESQRWSQRWQKVWREAAAAAPRDILGLAAAAAAAASAPCGLPCCGGVQGTPRFPALHRRKVGTAGHHTAARAAAPLH